MRKKILSISIIFTMFFGLITSNLTAVQAATDWSDAKKIEEVKQFTGVVNNNYTTNPKVKVKGYLTSKDARSGTSNTVFVFSDVASNSDYNTANAIQVPTSATGIENTTLRALVTNAEIGTLFGLEGTLDLYNSKLSIEKVTNVEILNGTPGEEDPIQTISIADARAKSGAKVQIEGIVTADNSLIGGGKLSTFVQDATGGINIFSATPTGFPDLKAGDLVRVKGTITEYRNLTEIIPDANGIEILQTGQVLPNAKLATIEDLNNSAIGESLEGQLVKVKGFVQSIPSTPAGGGYNVVIIDETFRGTTLRVMEGSLDIVTLQSNKWYEFTGVVGQFNEDYQIIPTGSHAVKLLDPQPDAPQAAGLYDSVVASIVDGDTVHLTTPVLGATKVRFVNIDTPETYHTPVTEADQNQKDHGLVSKAYLNSLLRAGDAVTLKIGEEPMDAYGRLLAQIIRKSDNMNVNLEMVKKGHASTYFIWPIGNDYEVYSEAVKEAYDAGLGIWNPSNPLMELPFEFRAREQGKGFTRFVGNYFSKKYVSPEKWESIPVEARVFFNSEDEAKANGYTFAGTTDPNPSENIKVQLLGVNDLHGKIDVTATVNNVKYGRADYLAAYMRQREAENVNTLMIHSGDMFGGSSPVSALLQDEPTVEIMESIGFDVGTVGNHEFDEGVTELLRMINGGDHVNGTKGYDGINFPTIAANVEYKDNGNLLLEPYTIKEVNGIKVGFIGVVTVDAPRSIMPSGIQSIRFTDEAVAINKYVPELQAQGVESIVILAHVPGDQDGTAAKGDVAQLAYNVDDAVDIIFAAHNHQKVNGVVDNKLIVQAWEYGNAFVDIDVEIDPVTKDIVKKSAEIVDVVQANIQPDPAVAGILAKYGDQVAPKVNMVVGYNENAMVKGYPTKAAIGDNALGNLIADGMKFAMNADFALMNGGGVRDNVNVGDITWGELFNVQPFGNTLVKLDVTGKQFIDILNAMINPSFGPDSFVGGARYTWNTATNKVVDLYLENGNKIDPAATYSLVVNNFMYNSSTTPKYRLLSQYGTNVVQGPDDIEATVAFVKSFNGQPISYVADGRISTDIVSPITIAHVDGATDGAYNNKDVKITFSATDVGVGVKGTYYSLNNGPWTIGTEVVLTTEGKNFVTFYSNDKVGNKELPQTITVLIDKTAPKITVPDTISIYHYEKLETSILVEDALSGVKKVAVVLDGDEVTTDISVDPLKLEIGTHLIEVKAEDNVGNIATKFITVEVKMDLAHLDELVAYGVKTSSVDENFANSLLSKVQSAQKAQDTKTKDNILNALKNEVEAQTGKKIEKSFADVLIEDLVLLQNPI